MDKDLSYAVARLLFYTEPTDRALIGWQPFTPWHGSMSEWSIGAQWDYSVNAESRNIASALSDE
jgi:hypothetical protein